MAQPMLPHPRSKKYYLKNWGIWLWWRVLVDYPPT